MAPTAHGCCRHTVNMQSLTDGTSSPGCEPLSSFKHPGRTCLSKKGMKGTQSVWLCQVFKRKSVFLNYICVYIYIHIHTHRHTRIHIGFVKKFVFFCNIFQKNLNEIFGQSDIYRLYTHAMYSVYMYTHTYMYYGYIRVCVCFCTYMCLSLSMFVQSLSCDQLCNPMDCSPPGSSVYRILQARVLEWVAIFFSRGSS